MNGPSPELLPGYEVFERIVARLHALKAQFPHLAAFSKDDYLGHHQIQFVSDDCRSIPNPDFADQLAEFEETLRRTAPRASSWIERNRPRSELSLYGPSGLSLYLRMMPTDEPWQTVIPPHQHAGHYKVVALEIEGLEHSDFSKLAAAIRTLVREELEWYQESHPA